MKLSCDIQLSARKFREECFLHLVKGNEGPTERSTGPLTLELRGKRQPGTRREDTILKPRKCAKRAPWFDASRKFVLFVLFFLFGALVLRSFLGL